MNIYMILSRLGIVLSLLALGVSIMIIIAGLVSIDSIPDAEMYKVLGVGIGSMTISGFIFDQLSWEK